MLLPLRMAASSFCQIWVRQCYGQEKMITRFLENCDFCNFWRVLVWELPFFCQKYIRLLYNDRVGKNPDVRHGGCFSWRGTPSNKSSWAISLFEFFWGCDSYFKQWGLNPQDWSFLPRLPVWETQRRSSSMQVPIILHLSLKLLDTICIHAHRKLCPSTIHI